ncbi:hypothetical protein ADUPG1_013706 [Aduncisulcus paluster]|uniref:Armadillo repeat-containing protein 8 n=1 Tax=Aduncisulcus paluster TaxID=2918883 RepID=A0ABQ5K4D6_9EUKA|nr:hypothetical protein ADUPG1_013706 [Aduncisulcus paluster]
MRGVEDSEQEEELPEILRERRIQDDSSPFTTMVTIMTTSSTPSQVILALSTAKSSDFSTQRTRLLFYDAGGLQALLGLVSSSTDARVRKEALSILSSLANYSEIQHALYHIGVIRSCIDVLNEGPRPGEVISEKLRKARGIGPLSSQPDVQAKAAELISKVLAVGAARHQARQVGISVLIRLLKIGYGRQNIPSPRLEVVRSACAMCASLVQGQKARESVQRADGVRCLCGLCDVDDIVILKHVTKSLLAFCKDVVSRNQMFSCDIIPKIIKILTKTDVTLLTQTSLLLSYLSVDSGVAQKVAESKGGVHIVALLSKDITELSLAGCSIIHRLVDPTPSIAQMLVDCRAVSELVRLISLKTSPLPLISLATRALASLLSPPETCGALRKVSGGVSILVSHLQRTEIDVLAWTCTALANTARNPDVRKQVLAEKIDPVLLLWSLLRHPNKRVISSAASALCPLLSVKEVSIRARELVGGLEIITQLLKCGNAHIQAHVCGMVAELGKVVSNVKVLGEYGVLPTLSTLAHSTTNLLVREHVSAAVAAVAPVSDHCSLLGELGVVPCVCEWVVDDEDMAANVLLRHCIKSRKRAKKFGLEEELRAVLPSRGKKSQAKPSTTGAPVLPAIGSSSSTFITSTSLAPVDQRRIATPWKKLGDSEELDSAFEDEYDEETEEMEGEGMGDDASEEGSDDSLARVPWSSMLHNRDEKTVIAMGKDPQLLKRIALSVKEKIHRVNLASCRALSAMSVSPANSKEIREEGSVKPLCELIKHDDWDIQEAAATCVRNVRRNHVAAVEKQKRKEFIQKRKARLRKAMEEERGVPLVSLDEGASFDATAKTGTQSIPATADGVEKISAEETTPAMAITTEQEVVEPQVEVTKPESTIPVETKTDAVADDRPSNLNKEQHYEASKTEESFGFSEEGEKDVTPSVDKTGSETPRP